MTATPGLRPLRGLDAAGVAGIGSRWWAATGWTLLAWAQGAELPGLEDGPRDVVAWAGGCGGAGAGLFDADPRTWAPRTVETLLHAGEALARRLDGRGTRLWVRPHARHALSDGPSMGRFAAALAGSGVGVLPDPAAVLTGAMLGRAETHLERLAEHAAGLVRDGRAAGVVIANVARRDAGADEMEPDVGPPLVLKPVHAGVIDVSVIAAALAGTVPAGAMVWLVPGEEERQVALLAGVLAGGAGDL